MGRAGCSSQRGGGIWYGEGQNHGWRAAARVLPRRSGEAGGFSFWWVASRRSVPWE
jgi:hypothetical protein